MPSRIAGFAEFEASLARLFKSQKQSKQPALATATPAYNGSKLAGTNVKLDAAQVCFEVLVQGAHNHARPRGGKSFLRAISACVANVPRRTCAGIVGPGRGS